MTDLPKKIVFKDEPYDIGPKHVRMSSIDHLRYGNPFAAYSSGQLLAKLSEYTDDPHGAASLAIDRLRLSKAQPDDKKILAVLIYHGQMYGLGASPEPPILANLLWQTAAIVLEQNGVVHPNEIPG